MRRAVLVALSLLSFAAGQADAADWISLRTPHFLLIGDASTGEVRDVALRFEQFREAVTTVFPTFADDKIPGPPVVVFVFKNGKSFEPFQPLVNGKPGKFGGYFLPARDVNYITLTADSRGPEFQTVYHEFTYVLIHRLLPNLPPWFDEGIAEYFSTFELAGRSAHFGAPVDRHLDLLQQRQMPLSEVFAVTRDSAVYNPGASRDLFDAESWALLHYAIIEKPERLAQLARFRTLVDSGDTIEAAFNKAFGFPTTALDAELLKYVRRPALHYQIVAIEQKISGRVQADVTRLSEPEAQAWLGNLLAHAGRTDEATARLEKALEAAPDLALAHASLGALLMRQKNNDLAMPHLQRAAALNSPNEFVHYYYGAALVERAAANPSATDDLQNAIAALARAVELRPGFTEAENMLGYAHLLRGETEMARDVLRRALDENPGEYRTGLMLAQAEIRLGHFNQARALLGPIVGRATEPDLKEQARRLLAQSAAVELQQRARAGAGSTSRPAPLATTAPEPVNTDAGAQLPDPGSTGPQKPMPVLRQRQGGENRTYGLFVAVECASSGAVVLQVRAAGSTLRVRAAKFTDVDFISYRRTSPGSIACGPRTPPEEVYVTWKPDPGGAGGSATGGTAVAVELLPEGYVPEP